MRSNEATNPISGLEFETLQEGDQILITTGTGEDAWTYEFSVEDATDKQPSGSLVAVNPQGQRTAPIHMFLHGCGRWTRPERHPVWEPYYDGIIVGHYLIGQPDSAYERWVFDRANQEISAIEVI